MNKIFFNYRDFIGQQYTFNIYKGMEDWIITVGCFKINNGGFYGYVKSLNEFLILPSNMISDDAKKIVVKYINNVIFA